MEQQDLYFFFFFFLLARCLSVTPHGAPRRINWTEGEGGDGCRDSQQDFLGIRADFHKQNQTIKPSWGAESHT